MVKVAPSILSADFAALADGIAKVEAAGADQLHVDVMDGRFVPNITIGPVVVEAIRKRTRLPLDVHLMIVEPERYLGDFVAAGADMVTVHVEACPHLQRTLAQVRELGARAGAALNPATSPTTRSSVQRSAGGTQPQCRRTRNPRTRGCRRRDPAIAVTDTLRPTQPRHATGVTSR